MINGNSYTPGNGNGNKMNLRVQILDNLISATGDETSAKKNSLRQSLLRAKSDMADDTQKSLDVLRQIFQNEFTEEIKAIIDRHLRTTFTPAFENLRRNGYEISETDINELACAILDGAKRPYLPTCEPPDNVCIPAMCALKKKKISYHYYGDDARVCESDDNESDISGISHGSQVNGFGVNSLPNDPNNLRKRGRPRKIDVDTGRNGSPIMNGTHPVATAEAYKWNPARIMVDSRFVTASKLNKLMGFGNRGHVFNKYIRMFRYVADDEDKIWLFNRNYSTRINKKLFLILLDDALEVCYLENAPPHIFAELQRFSFCLSEGTLQKIRSFMNDPYERLKSRVIEAPQNFRLASQISTTS